MRRLIVQLALRIYNGGVVQFLDLRQVFIK